MKTLTIILWGIAMLGIAHAPLLAQEMAEAVSTSVTLHVGTKTISAELPKEVQTITRSPQQEPTFIQGTKGGESLQIGRSDDFDIYSIQVFEPQLLKKHGHGEQVTNLEQFITQEIEHYKKKYDVVNKERQVPESLQAANAANPETERYLLLSGAYKKHKQRKDKQYLWRVMLVDDKIVLAQREIGAGYVSKNKISPKDEKEWEFLKSITIN